MPLKLVPPRKGKTPSWYIRGTYLKVPVNRSAGTSRRAVARQELKRLEASIERGEFAPGGATFADAVMAYIRSGGERRYLKPLVAYFETMDCAVIKQKDIDECAAEIYPPGISAKPNAINATINRCIHSPMSAVLKGAGFDFRIKRPKQPTAKSVWLEPGEATEWISLAPAKLRRLSVFLLHTGCRVTETCNLLGDHIIPAQSLAYIGRSKNGEGRAVYLPAPVLAELRDVTLKRGERVFGYEDRWQVYRDWTPLRKEHDFPDWWTPHAACHTWATWMRQYSKSDLQGLMATGRWRDIKSVERYTHVVVSEESRRADLLPVLVENPWTDKKIG
jgi:hypothetical protein